MRRPVHGPKWCTAMMAWLPIALSDDGSPRDIAVVFTLLLAGTWTYSWFLSGIWLDRLKGGRPNA